MTYIILDILKTSIYISIPITLIFLLKDKVLNQYTYRLNYVLSILITLRMIFISNIKIYLPYEIFKTQINSTNPTIKNLHYINNETISSLGYIQIIFIIWIIGFVYVFSKNVYNQIIFYKKMKNITYKITDLSTINCLKEEKQLLNIKRNINVFKVDGLSSPALINIFNSKIIIPDKDYDTKELKWIFRHELTHFKRKDNLLKLLLMIACSIHWFNPLVKILKVYFYDQCELSCDEKVLKKSNISDAKGYALALINTLKYKNNLKATMLHSQFNTNQINLIKRRIDGMINLKKRKKGILLTISVCAISAFSVITFNVNNKSNLAYANDSLPHQENKQNEENTKSTPTPKHITDEELIKNFENVKESDMKDLMEFYPDRKFEDLTQEEVDYALDFLFTGKCKKVNIGSDTTYSINLDMLKKGNKN